MKILKNAMMISKYLIKFNKYFKINLLSSDEKDKIMDQSDVERINREIIILKQVRHPHIV
jgi:hypothetical protein